MPLSVRLSFVFLLLASPLAARAQVSPTVVRAVPDWLLNFEGATETSGTVMTAGGGSTAQAAVLIALRNAVAMFGPSAADDGSLRVGVRFKACQYQHATATSEGGEDVTDAMECRVDDAVGGYMLRNVVKENGENTVIDEEHFSTGQGSDEQHLLRALQAAGVTIRWVVPIVDGRVSHAVQLSFPRSLLAFEARGR